MEQQKHLTREACLALLSAYHTPAHVIRHCTAVADTALAVGKALNEAGFFLDIKLIECAGMIHDIARVEDEHWEVGARKAEQLGLLEEADIIRRHMFYSPCKTVTDISEIDLVCLGDRLVKEDQYVGLESRMQYILDKAKANGNSDAEAAIRRKTADLQTLIDDIERVTGRTIDDLIKEKVD